LPAASFEQAACQFHKTLILQVLADLSPDFPATFAVFQSLHAGNGMYESGQNREEHDGGGILEAFNQIPR
jgi:hypothetical protein